MDKLIKINPEIKERLDKLRNCKCEDYNDLIGKLIDLAEICGDKKPVKQTFMEIKSIIKEIKKTDGKEKDEENYDNVVHEEFEDERFMPR